MGTMAYGLGVGAVPYTMLGELFTPKVSRPKTAPSNFTSQNLPHESPIKFNLRIIPSFVLLDRVRLRLNSLMCEKAKHNIMTCNSYSGGQEYHSVWTSEIDSNYGN